MQRAPQWLFNDYNNLWFIDLTTNQVPVGYAANVHFEASSCLVGGSLNAAKRRCDRRSAHPSGRAKKETAPLWGRFVFGVPDGLMRTSVRGEEGEARRPAERSEAIFYGLCSIVFGIKLFLELSKSCNCNTRVAKSSSSKLLASFNTGR